MDISLAADLYSQTSPEIRAMMDRYITEGYNLVGAMLDRAPTPPEGYKWQWTSEVRPMDTTWTITLLLPPIDAHQPVVWRNIVGTHTPPVVPLVPHGPLAHPVEKLCTGARLLSDVARSEWGLIGGAPCRLRLEPAASDTNRAQPTAKRQLFKKRGKPRSR